MTENTQYTDEYFISLTMDYDKRDDEIYPLWAVWCAKSDDRYYIDGKDGHFYTHIRTDKEIAIERKRREIMDILMSQERQVDDERRPTKDWMGYERYIHELQRDEDTILDVTAMTFEEWKAARDESNA